MNKSVWTTVIVAILVGAIAFYAGMQYQKSQRGAGRGFGGNFAYTNGSGATMAPVRGQIISTNGNSITVKLSDGSSKIVLISSTTSIMKAAKASTSDLSNGANVLVIGTSNSDGSVTASNISLNPQGMFMRRAGSGSSNQGQ